MMLHRVIKNSRVFDVQYKILHNVINTAVNLKNWRIRNTDQCLQCNEQQEDSLHYFVTCKKNSNIIRKTLEKWNLKPPDNKDILMGTTDKKLYLFISYIKEYIYNYRQYKQNMDYINVNQAVEKFLKKILEDALLYTHPVRQIITDTLHSDYN